MKEYKTKESDTISLHDNFIEKIIIEMDGFDITKENEYNKTGKHKFAENTCKRKLYKRFVFIYDRK